MIEPDILVGWALTGAAVIGHVFVADYRIKRNERDTEKALESVSNNIKDFWAWKQSHEKDSSDTREKLLGQISEVKGSQLVQTEQFKQILSALEEIKDRLTNLENHRGGLK